ncbi:capsule biosynthesis GfcC family protein [Cobetia sp. 1AS1]|uniref:capsule biosynthesis GfcC family protein n=1 Tax=Cobetia sp. 1AS1 TaxID=3040016 RepID=UPI00244B5BF2|nr:capsule biosynthesis GfcC family protein [Cobetia sp. 1AS1]MDH2294212.1 capsule biosynthesis GfcC family protein [Cobetia sp. 1AS1]
MKSYLHERLKAALGVAMLASACGAFLLPGAALASETPAASQGPSQDQDASAQTLTISEALSRQLGVLTNANGIEWPHAFVATQQTRDRTRELGRRLFFELRQLSSQAVFDDRLSAEGLKHWMRIIGRTSVEGRQVGRIDPIALWRFPRLDIPLTTGDWIGQCQTETRIQLWSAVGVRQLDWRPGLTLHDAIAGLPGAQADSEHASVITLGGRIIVRGISAWNDQPYTLAPGDRVVVNMPRISAAAAWVNRSLPEWLSLQWPGKECRSVDAITGEPQQRDYLQVARQYADSDDRNDSDHRDDKDSGSLPQGDTP